MMTLEIKPLHLKEANEFVKQYHRHNIPTVGGKFAIGCYYGDRLCGVAICGRPTARRADNGITLKKKLKRRWKEMSVSDMKYYLFLKNPKDLAEYKQRFLTTKERIEKGVTPVYNEVNSAKTNLFESLPYNLLNGLFLIFGTILIDKLNINSLLGVAVVLVVNSLCSCLSNFIFVVVKHKLRINLCNRLEIPPTDKNIAVMESMEYQTV